MSTNCVGTVDKDQSLILSPNHPNEYPHELNCTWKLRVPQGKRILLHFEKFDTYEKFDYLVIHDGSNDEDEILAALSGKFLQNIQSTGSKLSLRFTSTKNNEHFTGFQIRYEGTKRFLIFQIISCYYCSFNRYIIDRSNGKLYFFPSFNQRCYNGGWM